jgi:hypothetical protein
VCHIIHFHRLFNIVTADYGTIGGGKGNQSAMYATVGGGDQNTASGGKLEKLSGTCSYTGIH